MDRSVAWAPVGSPASHKGQEDIEGFLKRHRGRRVALDEIHRLADRLCVRYRLRLSCTLGRYAADQRQGGLFEHLVLDELCFEVGAETWHSWRDKQKHEIDFVWTPRGRPPVAIECTWRAAGFDPVAMQVCLPVSSPRRPSG